MIKDQILDIYQAIEPMSSLINPSKINIEINYEDIKYNKKYNNSLCKKDSLDSFRSSNYIQKYSKNNNL